MNVIAVKTIRGYQQSCLSASSALDAWLKNAKTAKWQSPEDVRAQYPKVSILHNGRLVFNIMHNSYRLVVRANYKSQSIYVRWFGTHRDYDRVDADTI